MPSDFTWLPSVGGGADVTPRLFRSQMGAGYSQTMADGPNAIDDTYNLVFNHRSTTELAAIDTFLRSKIGLNFTFTPPAPDNTQIKVEVVKPWKKTYTGGILRGLSVTFERVYVA